MLIWTRGCLNFRSIAICSAKETVKFWLEIRSAFAGPWKDARPVRWWSHLQAGLLFIAESTSRSPHVAAAYEFSSPARLRRYQFFTTACSMSMPRHGHAGAREATETTWRLVDMFWFGFLILYTFNDPNWCWLLGGSHTSPALGIANTFKWL